MKKNPLIITLVMLISASLCFAQADKQRKSRKPSTAKAAQTDVMLSSTIIASDKDAAPLSGFLATDVGHGFSFTNYWVADWTGDGTPDLLVMNAVGTLQLYPFKNGSFYNGGGPKQVGHGFTFTHYFVADWTGDGTPDLLVRNNQGDLLLYPFKGGSFYSGGGPKLVGNGWVFTDYFVADWTGDGIPDLIVRKANGDLRLYPFKNGSFY